MDIRERFIRALNIAGFNIKKMGSISVDTDGRIVLEDWSVNAFGVHGPGFNIIHQCACAAVSNWSLDTWTPVWIPQVSQLDDNDFCMVFGKWEKR